MSVTDAEGAAEWRSLIGAKHGEFMMTLLKRSVALLLSVLLVLVTAPEGFAYQTEHSAAPPPPQAAQQTPEQLQQLVAPIALYPDALAAQILAAATYPAEVVEADRWMQQHSDPAEHPGKVDCDTNL